MITEQDLKSLLKSKQYFRNSINIFFKRSLNKVYEKGNYANIEQILDILEKYGPLYLIEKCPTILALGKSKEIESIISLLKTNDLLNIINQCPTILARGKSKEIEDIINLVKSINGDIHKLPLIYFLDYNKVHSIVFLDKEEQKEEFAKNVKLHIKLIGKYNKIYTKPEINKLIKTLNVSYDDLLDCFFSYIIDCKNLLNRTFQEQGYIWIGDSIPCTSEQMHMYSNVILKVVNIISKYNRLGVAQEQIYDCAMDGIMNKCGNIFINYGKTEALEPVLYKYLSKYILCILKNATIEFDKISNIYHYNQEIIDNNFIGEYYYLTKEEQQFLYVMSNSIEMGCNYMETLNIQFGYSEEEIFTIIEAIKEKISSNEEGKSPKTKRNITKYQ